MTGPVEVAPGVYLVGGEEPVEFNALCYLVRGARDVLVDCGSLEGLPTLRRNLARRGVRPEGVALVAGTHGHRDHVQGAACLPVPLLLHPAGVRAVGTGDPDRTAAYLFGRPFVPVRAAAYEGDRVDLGAGACLEVVATPGHSPDSVCLRLVRPGRPTVLFGGDTTWGGYAPRLGSDLAAWRASLGRLLALEFEVILPGHAAAGSLPHPRGALERAAAGFGRQFRPSFGGLWTPWE